MFTHLTYNESTLENGMKVLTARSGVPAVDAQVWVRAGYRYEKDDELGYAHLLEHMLMKGTERYPTAELLAMQVVSQGGYTNAFTNQEYAGYSMLMMADDTELMFDLLADQLFNSVIDPKVLENEKAVVLHELRIRRDNSDQYLFRLIQKKLFAEHPLSRNILDTEQTTKDATSERLKNYLARNYRPDQSALVLTGDIPHERAVALARTYFGGWQRPDTGFDNGLKELHRTNEPSFHEFRDTEQTFFALCYYTEAGTELKARAAWQVLRTYLAGKHTGVLYRRLRSERGLVYYVVVQHWSYPDAGLVIIKTSTRQPAGTLKVAQEAVAGIGEELTDELFERAKQQTLGNAALELSLLDRQAERLGENFVAYDRLVTPDEWLGLLTEVTRDDVLRLAKTYLRPENSVLVSLGKTPLER